MNLKNSLYKLLFAVTACAVVLSGCRKKSIPQKTVQINSQPDSPGVSATTASQPDSLIAVAEPGDFKIEEIDFAYLVAKSKVSFKSQSQNYDNANVNIRIKKDSLIWFSVTGLGIEVARGLISRDSIIIADKFHKEYYSYDFERLSKQFNFELSFNLIQSVIIGNLPIPKEPGERFKKEKDFLLLHQKKEKVLVDNYIGEDHKLKKLQAIEQPTKNSLTLDYEDFQSLNNFLFPYASLVTLDIQSSKNKEFYQTVIRLKHSKVELKDENPGFPFSIPKGYKKK